MCDNCEDRNCNSCPILFPVGCRIVKKREYSKYKYCLYGGTRKEVPIGTQGTVTRTYTLKPNKICVNFDNGTDWHLAASELEKVL